jgi:hypothetical protein
MTLSFILFLFRFSVQQQLCVYSESLGSTHMLTSVDHSVSFILFDNVTAIDDMRSINLRQVLK